MKKIVLLTISIVSSMHAKVIIINTAVSTIIELRNHYYDCVYDDQAHTIMCSRNQTAPFSMPSTITFSAKDGIHKECSIGLNNDRELIGTYENNNTICTLCITKQPNRQLGQTTNDEWIDSYQEE